MSALLLGLLAFARSHWQGVLAGIVAAISVITWLFRSPTFVEGLLVAVMIVLAVPAAFAALTSGVEWLLSLAFGRGGDS